MRQILNITALVVALLVTGCATNKSREVYATLYSIGKTTDGAVKAYMDLVVAGKVPGHTIGKVSKAYNDFQLAYATALSVAEYDLNAPVPEPVRRLSQNVMVFITEAELTP